MTMYFVEAYNPDSDTTAIVAQGLTETEARDVADDLRQLFPRDSYRVVQSSRPAIQNNWQKPRRQKKGEL